MKLSHKLHTRTTAPLWLLTIGLVLSTTGVGLFCHALSAAQESSQSGQSFAVTAVLLGVIAVVYAAHELSQRRRHV